MAVHDDILVSSYDNYSIRKDVVTFAASPGSAPLARLMPEVTPAASLTRKHALLLHNLRNHNLQSEMK